MHRIYPPLAKTMARETRTPLGLLLLSLALFMAASAAAAYAQAGPDVPSGFFPGDISVFEGGGTQFASGSPAIGNAAVPQVLAFDGQGNLYIGTDGGVSLVYSGALPVPPILAAVSSNPQAGSLYSVVGYSGGQTSGSTAANTAIANVQALAFDASGNLFIAEGPDIFFSSPFAVIVKVDAKTTVATIVAGQIGVASPAPGTGPGIGDGGPATSAILNAPTGLAVDSEDNIYIADVNDEIIRVVYGGGKVPAILTAESLVPTSGFIYTVAGQFLPDPVYQGANAACEAPGTCFPGEPLATSGSFGNPVSVAVDSDGNLYILDSGNNYYTAVVNPVVRVVYGGLAEPAILKSVTSSPVPGHIYTVAGSESSTCAAATPPAVTTCGDGGLALNASFNAPLVVSVDTFGNIYVADNGDNTVRKVDYSGYISDIAGVETPGLAPPIGVESGPATSVQFNGVPGFALDAQSNLYVADHSSVVGTHDLVWKALPLQPQTITFNPLNPVTYGAGPIGLHATSDSGLPVTYSATGPATVSDDQLFITGAGTVAVTAAQAGNGTYAAAANVSQSFAVNPATLTVSAKPASKIYQTPNPAFAAAITGFVSPDTQQAVLTGQPAFSTTAQTNSNAGSYPINVAQGSLAFTSPAYQTDYTLALVPGTLLITGATAQTITFGALASTGYGQAPLALTATASSGQPVTYSSSNPAVASVSGSTLTIHGAGTVTLTASQVGNNTYAAASPVTQALTISPAPLTVTGPVFSVNAGAAINPAAFPAPTITGFVGGDTQALVTGRPTYTTTATTGSAVGSYPVQVSQGGLQLIAAAAANYTFGAFQPGTLTVVGTPQTISFQPLFDTSFSNTPPQPTAVASSGLPVTFTVAGAAVLVNGFSTTNPAGGVNSVGLGFVSVGTVTVTATQAGNAQYAAATPVTETFSVTPGTLNVYLTPGTATRTFGVANPLFGFNLGINVPGDFPDIPSAVTGVPTITTTATPDSPPGDYPVTISAGTLVAPNYNLAFTNGTLTVLPAGSYTITSTPATLTIPRGQSRQVSLTVTPNNLYQGTVTLSCGQLPANVSCIFSPATFTFTGSQEGSTTSESAAQGTLTINTVGGDTVIGAIQPSPSAMERASILLPGGLAGLLLLRSRKRLAKHGAVLQLCVLAMLTAGVLGLSSCGSNTAMNGKTYAATGTTSLVITGAGTSPSGTGGVTSSLNLSVTIE